MSKKYLLPIIIATVYLCLLLLVGASFGAFTQGESVMAIRIRNAAIGMPFMTAFAGVAAYFISEKSKVAIRDFLAAANLNNYTHALTNAYRTKIRILWKTAIPVSFLITLSYLLIESLASLDQSALLWFMNLSAVPFWISCIFLMSILFFNTRYIIKNFLDKDSLDLFGIKEIKPIADLVIYNTAVFACYLALTPFFWLGKDVPMFDLIAMLMIFTIFAIYLFLPIVKVHNMLAKHKRLAIERLNHSIKKLISDLSNEQQNALYKSPVRIRRLATLISAKQEISKATEWPIDLPQGVKGLLISISIPLSWVAGSIVEGFISKSGWF